MIHPVTPILSIPNAATTGETLAGVRLLDTATRLEGIISDRLWDAPGIGHAYVSSGGGTAMVVLQREKCTQEFRDDLRRILNEIRDFGNGPCDFLADMAQRIQFAAWAADSADERTAFAYVLRRFTERQNLLWYSPLAYASSNGERGLAYFFGCHYRPVLRSSSPAVLGEKLTDVGFGVTASLSLFVELKALEDLNENEGFINPLAQKIPVRQTEEGWTIG